MRSPLLTHFRWWPRRHHQLLHQNLISTRSSCLTAGSTLDTDWLSTDDKESDRVSLHLSINNHASTRSGTGVEAFDRRHPKASVRCANDLFTRISTIRPRGNNSTQWLSFLETQRIRHGFEGVKAVWQCMQARKIQFRSSDEAAHKIWSILLFSFLDRPELLEGLIQYAGRSRNGSGDDFGFLYTPIMEHMLQHRPEISAGFFALLRDQGLVPVTRAVQCISASIHSQDPTVAFDTFQHIYISGSERSIYDACIQDLQRSHASYKTVCKWHAFLLSHGDTPSAALKSNTLVKILCSRVWEANVDDLLGNPSVDSDESVLQHPPLTRERLSTVIGEIHGIKQKSVTDAFCARMFATGGLTTGFLIAGLAMLGLDTMGPLAMRELAARSQTTSAFQEALQLLRERKVAITPCTFSKALRKFAEEDRQEFFDGIVKSDRHPDIYEDRELLERLIDDYLRSDQAVEAHTILAVLSMSVKHLDEYRWNALIQAETRIHRPQKVAAVLKDMIGQKLEVTEETISCIRTRLLTPRDKGKRPQITGKRKLAAQDDLVFVTNLLLYIANTGKYIHISHWRELITRYGMESRMNGLHHLVMEVARQYLQSGAPADGLQRGNRRTPSRFLRAIRIDSPLRQLFNPIMQCAIVTWGFNSEVAEKYLPTALKGPDLASNSAEGELWLRGISLLVHLRDAGALLDIPAVRRQVVTQLGNAHMPRFSNGHGGQRIVVRDGAELLRRYDLVERTWGSKGLFKFCNGRKEASEADRLEWVLFCLFDRSGWIANRRKKRRPARV